MDSVPDAHAPDDAVVVPPGSGVAVMDTVGEGVTPLVGVTWPREVGAPSLLTPLCGGPEVTGDGTVVGVTPPVGLTRNPPD